MEEEEEIQQRLRELYYGTNSSGGYGGVERLLRAARKENLNISRTQIRQFLLGQQPYSLHKPTVHKIRTRKTYVARIDQQWQIDLADMQKLAKHNDGYKYIMTCIDVLSKYAWAVPVKSKSSRDMLDAMQRLFKEAAPRVCERLQSDKGNEFMNREVQRLLNTSNIAHFITQSTKKASIVERFNRTLKSRLWTYFTAHRTQRYVDVLPKFMQGYNQSYHRSIKMCPADVTHANELQVWQNLFGNGDTLPTRGVQPGEMVRITKWKDTFDKGYQQNWTDEHFLVDTQVPGSNNEFVYKLHDYAGEPIEGTFYAKEIQPIKYNGYYVESVLKERKNKYTGEKEFFVKWKGWGPEFNCWLSQEQVLASWRNEVNNSTFTFSRRN